MITAIVIPRLTYEEVLDAVEKEAVKEDRSHTKMASILIMEAVKNRAAQQPHQDRPGGSNT